MRPTPPSDTTQLYLLRHGATPANEQRPYILQGNGIDLALSPSGERQVAALSRFLSDFPLTQIYCSRMLRARQTAQAVAAPHGLDVQPIDGIDECDVGIWEGMDWESVQRKYPDYWERFNGNPADYPYLEGESYRDVQRRVAPVLQSLLERHRGTSIAVVAHNVVNRVYLASLLGLELRLAKELRQQNGCINCITHNSRETVLVTLNSTFHLDQPCL